MIDFISGLPHNIYVAQTKIQYPSALPSQDHALDGFNLALHVADDPARVQQHRISLLNDLHSYGANQLTWLNQTHSTICHRVDHQCFFKALSGDALVTSDQGHVLMIMTADCLPIVLGNKTGTEIANLHAGWRGLANGIIEQTILMMKTPATWAWLGAAISQSCFEVGEEVKHYFITRYPDVASCFIQGQQQGKYFADLYAIARHILTQQGVTSIFGGDQCSYQQKQDYYSYRRHSHTGRMATLAFIGR